MYFGFLEHHLQRFLDKTFLLGRTTGAVEEDVRQRARPQERRYLRQQLVGDAVLHRDRCLEKRVDTVGENVRTLSACGDQTPVHFRASTISNKDHDIYDLTIYDLQFNDLRFTIFIFSLQNYKKILIYAKKSVSLHRNLNF